MEKPADCTDAATTDEDVEEVPEEWIEEAEEDLYEELDANPNHDELGAFAEKDYAERIAGWAFKTLEFNVGPNDLEIKAFYRRPLDKPGARWERIGHSRGANALDLKRLVYCAKLRDERAARKADLADATAERRRRIDGLFGPGASEILDSLSAPSDAAPLTSRQEAFCRHYLSEPSGTRAAIKAGYAESGADVQASRLLGNARVLQKISALRRERALSYALDRDTMLDKLELVFDEAMRAESHSAALRALLAQAELSGLMNRRHKAAEHAEARARAEAADEAAQSAKDDT
jgi:phage terminase small subunit